MSATLRDQIAFRIYDAGAYCGDCEYTGWGNCSQCREVVRGYADAVLPMVSGPEALRSAARELPGFEGIRTHGDAARWLRSRADRMEGSGW